VEMLIFDTSCPTQLTIKSEEQQSAAKFTNKGCDNIP